MRARRQQNQHRVAQGIGALALTVLTALALIGWPRVPGSSPAFDGANGLGLSAMFALLLCCWLAPASTARYTAPALRLHSWLGVLVTAAVLAHALIMLLANEVAIEYLKWRAPAYMHAGNIGFLVLVILCILPSHTIRRRLHRDFNQFRRLHRSLSVLAIALAGWHILGSGYLIGAGHGVATGWRDSWLDSHAIGLWWRAALLATLLSIVTVLWWQQPLRTRPQLLSPDSEKLMHPIAYALALVVLAALYVLLLRESSG